MISGNVKVVLVLEVMPVIKVPSFGDHVHICFDANQLTFRGVKSSIRLKGVAVAAEKVNCF